MNEFFLNSPSFQFNQFYNFLLERLSIFADKYLGYIGTIVFALFSMNTVEAAQGDRIITVIKTLTQDIYTDFVYLSLGFVTTISIYHLIMIVFHSGDDQSRRKHVMAIITAVGAWVIINLFALGVSKIFGITGQTTPADIFNTGGYN